MMIGIAVLGAIVAGFYGILHDQITYSISSEYFTKLKFDQFYYADFGFPVRIFVSEIGFLATWWVGFISAWFLARIAVPHWPPKLALRRCLIGVFIIICFAFTAGSIGHLLGIHHSNDYSNWQDLSESLGVSDVPSFVHVGYIHNAGYIGGLIGLIVAIIYLLRMKKTQQDGPPNDPPLGSFRGVQA